MTSFRYCVKDIKPGDLVQYHPLGMARNEQNAYLFVAFGNVIVTEEAGSSMTVTVDWDTPGIPLVVDVNNVECSRHAQALPDSLPERPRLALKHPHGADPRQALKIERLRAFG